MFFIYVQNFMKRDLSLKLQQTCIQLHQVASVSKSQNFKRNMERRASFLLTLEDIASPDEEKRQNGNLINC